MSRNNTADPTHVSGGQPLSLPEYFPNYLDNPRYYRRQPLGDSNLRDALGQLALGAKKKNTPDPRYARLRELEREGRANRQRRVQIERDHRREVEFERQENERRGIEIQEGDDQRAAEQERASGQQRASIDQRLITPPRPTGHPRGSSHYVRKATRQARHARRHVRFASRHPTEDNEQKKPSRINRLLQTLSICGHRKPHRKTMDPPEPLMGRSLDSPGPDTPTPALSRRPSMLSPQLSALSRPPPAMAGGFGGTPAMSRRQSVVGPRPPCG